MGANVDKGEVEEMGRLKPKGGVRMSAQNKCSEGCGASSNQQPMMAQFIWQHL